MKRLLIGVVVSLILSAFAWGSDLIDDPCSIPPKLAVGVGTGERFRTLGDFNLDGIQDMAVSDDLASMGQSGINYTLYLGTASNKYYEYGTYFAPPRLISIEKRAAGEVRLWASGHINSQEGVLMCKTFGDDGFVDSQGIRVFTGDGGSAIGNAMFDAVFKNSEVAFRFQRSKTDSSGIHWSDF